MTLTCVRRSLPQRPDHALGAISDPKAGELVTVLAKECGIATGFRAVAGAQTTASGAWTVDYRPRSTTVLRAVWGSSKSPDVTVKQRAGVQLVSRPGRTFRVSVYGIVPLDGKRVRIERFDRWLGYGATCKPSSSIRRRMGNMRRRPA